MTLDINNQRSQSQSQSEKLVSHNPDQQRQAGLSRTTLEFSNHCPLRTHKPQLWNSSHLPWRVIFIINPIFNLGLVSRAQVSNSSKIRQMVFYKNSLVISFALHFISTRFNIFRSIFISPQLNHSDIMTAYKCIYNNSTQAGVQQSCWTIYGRLVTSFVLHFIAIYYLFSLVKTLTLIYCKQVTVFGP